MHTSKFLDPSSPPHIFTLVALAGLGALSLNLFLPSLPNMATFFNVEYSKIQLAISGYLAGTAIVQIFIGPLSDRFGRRPVMLAGLTLFLCATLVAGLAQNYTLFIVARVFQVSVAAGLVLSRAIIRDLYSMDQAASVIGYVTMGMALVPMVGPVLGGLLEEQFGWQANMVALLLLGLMVTILTYFDLGETNQARTSSLGRQFSELPELIRSRRFWGYALTAMLSSGAFFSYLGGAPIVATKFLGLSPSQQGYYFGVLALGYMLGNFFSGRYSVRFGVNTMMLTGSLITTFGIALALAFVAAGVITPITTFGPLIFLGIGNGLSLPSTNAGIVSVRPHLAGSASGFGGALMIGGGAGLATLTGYLLDRFLSVYPLLLVMLVSATLAIFTTFYVIHIARQVARQAAPATSSAD